MHFVFYGKIHTHTHTPILSVATATIYLTYPKHTHTHAHSEYCSRTREKSAAATRWVSTLLTELLSDCRTPSAFARVCVRVGHFFSFFFFFLYTIYIIYMCVCVCVDAIFYRPTHYAQASGAICPVGRSAADPFNNVPGCRCQFPTLFNKPSAGTVS